MTSMGFFSSDSATRPSSQDCELCGKLGLHLPGKGRVRHRKGQLLVGLVAMLHVLLWSSGRKMVGPYNCRLKLRAGFEVGHVLGMAEAIDGQSVPLESPTSVLEHHIQPRVVVQQMLKQTGAVCRKTGKESGKLVCEERLKEPYVWLG